MSNRVFTEREPACNERTKTNRRIPERTITNQNYLLSNNSNSELNKQKNFNNKKRKKNRVGIQMATNSSGNNKNNTNTPREPKN